MTLLDRLVYLPLGKILSPLEDPVGTDRPLWRDYSYWQGVVDMAVAAANGVYGMFSRAGIGSTYTDPTFLANYASAAAHGIRRSSYHVLNPTQPVSAQADLWYAAHAAIDGIPRAIDLESSYGAQPVQIADVAWEMSEIVLVRDGYRPIIYSRYGLVNSWLSPFWTPDMLNQHFFWLAQYLYDRTREHAGPPTLPANVNRERVVLHQAADKKADFPGECSGSVVVDYDRWEIGDAAGMVSWIAANWAAVPPVEGKTQFYVLQEGLFVRTGPGTTYPVVRSLHAGDLVDILEIGGDDAWAEITPGEWANVKLNDDRNMEIAA